MHALAASAPRRRQPCSNEVHDDFEIEAAIGFALNAAGASTHGKVYVRSNLGEVQIDGFVPSERAADDIVRTVARVPGVRSVVNRLQVQPTATAGSTLEPDVRSQTIGAGADSPPLDASSG